MASKPGFDIQYFLSSAFLKNIFDKHSLTNRDQGAYALQ
jgi:hypothetical protein